MVEKSAVVSITVNAAARTGPYRPIWNWVGYDEPNYTYTPNGRKLLGELAALSPESVRVRTHNLLTSGDGRHALKWGSTNAYTEDAGGNAVYDWTIMDQIFDTYVETGCTPFIQVGFMPEALSDDPGPYRHDWALESPYGNITTGWAMPPNNMAKWSALIEEWARHLADRYGYERAAAWPWECWNEPDGYYWKGTIPEFCAMYDATVAAIRRVFPRAKVGGPHTCGAYKSAKTQAFLREFLQHVSDTGVPLDFVGFHAKGLPVLEDAHVRMGLGHHLLNIRESLAIMSEFPKLRGVHAIIGESDPEGCAACSARVHPQNNYRNGPLFGTYLVEHIVRTYELSRRAGIEIDGAVTWAFLFEGQPYFDGFRDLATNGIDKAVLNAFRMLGKLGGDWIETNSSHGLSLDEILAGGVREAADINAVATRDNDGVSILVWNYHDDDVPAADAQIAITLKGWPGKIADLRHFRMDEWHSNAFGVWRAMGSPQTIEGEDYRRLEAAGHLAQIEELKQLVVEDTITLRTTLPRQGVSLLRLSW